MQRKRALSKAIRIAHADEFIGYLPQGLETPIGERGKLLYSYQF